MQALRTMTTRSRQLARLEDLSNCVLQHIQAHLMEPPVCADLLVHLPRCQRLLEEKLEMCSDRSMFEQDILIGLKLGNNAETESLQMELRCKVDAALEHAYTGTFLRDVLLAEHNAVVFRTKYPDLILHHSRRISVGGIHHPSRLELFDKFDQGPVTFTPRSGLLTCRGTHVRLSLQFRADKEWTWAGDAINSATN